MQLKMSYLVPATLFALALLGAGPALAQQTPEVAQEQGDVDEVMMSVVGQENADEQAFAEDVAVPRSEGDVEDGGFGQAKEEAAGPGQLGLGVAEEARDLEGLSAEDEEFQRELGEVIDEAKSINSDAVRSEIPASEAGGQQ